MAINPSQAFVWGRGGQQLTPEEIAQARALETRRAMQGIDTSPVGHWTQGAARVADAIAGAFRRGALDRAEQANQAFNDKEFGSLSDYLAGGGAAYPESVAQGGSPTAPAALGENAPLIKAGLMERGIPEHIADGFVMNFQDESGLNPGINEANPTVVGSRGGYGLYQLTGPRRVAYEQFAKERGVAPSDTNAQLDFLVSELKGPEANAAKSIFAAPDAGTAAAAIATNFLRPNEKSLRERVARYTANNVAPVGFGDHGPTTQLPPEVRAQRLAQNQAGMVNFTDAGVPQANPAYAGVQTASLDPSIGMPTQTRAGDVITVPPIEQVNNAGAVPIQGNPITGTVTIPAEGASPAIKTNPIATGVGVGDVPAGTGGGEPTLDWTSQPNLSLAANIPFDNSQVPGNMGAAIPPQAVAAAVKPTAVPASVQRVSGALPIRPMADPNDVMVADMAHTEQPQQPTGQGAGYFPPAPSMGAPAAAQGGPDTALLVRAMTDPRASDKTRTIAKLIYAKQAAATTAAQKAIADRQQFVFEQQYKENLGSTKADIEAKRASTEESKARVADMAKTGNIKDYESYAAYEEQNGRTPLGPLEYRKALSAAGAPKNEGAIPPGYQAVRDEGGNITKYEPIPGGPADTSKKDTATSEAKGTSSDVIVNAAKLARKALHAKGLPATGTTGAILAPVRESNAAELRRQTAVLKSNATIEALNAMRAQSPTGGALGNVTEGEGQMLAAKAGVLDPDSPNFERDLADYERTLLRVVHGSESGDNIYWEQRELPTGVTQEDIETTMKANGMTRRQVMEKLYGGS